MAGMRHIAGWILVCAVLLGCDEAPPDPLLLPEMLRHANGLTVPRPDGYEVFEQADGFLFREAGDIRSPRSLEVVIGRTLPDLAIDGHRQLPGGGTAAYAARTLNGGSGGTEYALVAWRRVDGRLIVFREQAQSEWGEPGFALIWAVIDRTGIRPAD